MGLLDSTGNLFGDVFGGEGTDPSVEFKTFDLFTPEMQELFQSLIESIQGRQGDLAGARDLSISGLEDFIRQLTSESIRVDPSEFAETAYREGVEAPLLRDFRERIGPGIARSFSGTGNFFGSERRTADALAQEGLSRQLVQGRARTDLAYRGQALQESQLNLAERTSRGASLFAGAGLGDVQNQLLTQLLSIPQLENVGIAQAGSPGLLDYLFQGAGAAGGAYLGAAAFASDEELKTDIAPGDAAIVALLESIVPKEFRYKSEQPEARHVGVMAQDIEKSLLGKQMVIDTLQGKAIDIGQATGAVLAAAGLLHRRVTQLETI